MALYKTPGIYVEETNFNNHFITAAPTAIPVFVGYTEKAEKGGASLQHQVVSIASLLEYQQIFGGGFSGSFKLSTTGRPFDFPLTVGIKKLFVGFAPNNEMYLYNAVKLFYANGGGKCCILSVGSYERAKSRGIKLKDYTGNPADQVPSVFSILKDALEPTLLLFPDIVALRNATGQAIYYSLYKLALQHCKLMQYRMLLAEPARSIDSKHQDAISLFRREIGDEALAFGAAFYPWVLTNINGSAELGLPNFLATLSTLLKHLPPVEKDNALLIKKCLTNQPDDPLVQADLHKNLLANCVSYASMVKAATQLLNLMPAAGAVAGVMCHTDAARGVWKAPANIALQAVLAADVRISNEEQAWMNVDEISGKSVNVIRSFQPGKVLLWGARTLAGNDPEWRYINIKRTAMMIERSVSTALQAFVFEPNDANTWLRIKTMAEQFLYNLWRQGALAGEKPANAYGVQVGLGVTMTANDISEGKLYLQLMVAFIRPAEFTIIRIQQNMNKP